MNGVHQRASTSSARAPPSACRRCRCATIAIVAPDVAEVAEPLAADHVQLDLHAARLESREQRARFADEVRVERAGEAAVRGEQQHRRAAPAFGMSLRTALRLAQQREALGQLRRVEIARSPPRARARTGAPRPRDPARASSWRWRPSPCVRVILRVFSTDLIRPLSSRPFAMSQPVRRGLLRGRGRARRRGLVRLDAALELRLGLLRQHLLGRGSRGRPAGTRAS